MAELRASPALQDRVALVTGGGRGLGRVFALALAEAGATVAVTGRTESDLTRVVAEIAARNGLAKAARFDVTDRVSVDAGIAAIERMTGPIDILVNNAGIWGPIGNAWEVDPEAWWRTMEVHVAGALNCSRAVLPSMIDRGHGRIVNIVSHAGVHRWPTCSAYSVSKAAVIKMTENLAFELRRHGIVVFAFHPGLLSIGLGAEAARMRPLPGSAAERAVRWVMGEIEAGRAASPQRAAATLLELAEGVGDGLTGRYLTVDDDIAALAAARIPAGGVARR